ncbi:lipocalin-like domain-containing protein [Aerococcaceae bacterium DSM 111176]|nr:lipocalin-like domain-containing protein [Aerococcaceae bacterium DSM 111176]
MSKISRETLIGAWILEDYFIEDSNGNREYPLGENAQGIIMYTPDGYMSAQLMEPGRPEFEVNNMHKGQPDEYAKAAGGYHAYSGRFDFDEEKQELRHYMDVSLFPNYVGGSQIREARVVGDILYVSNPKFNNQLVWRRAKDNRPA